jgi:uncharacterized protein (TIGR02757 family)
MNQNAQLLREYAAKYNDPVYFQEDPIIFPKRFAEMYARGEADLKDVEVAAVIAAHLAWGRRSMIVRDCGRAFDEMGWKPYDYVMKGCYRCEPCSLHRTVKWSEFAEICGALKAFYEKNDTLEHLCQDDFRTEIFRRKSDPSAANKKINMLRRWMVRHDGKVDLGLWRDSSPADLIIPLDVHVHTVAKEMGLTARNSADIRTALEITRELSEIFPGDPCLGDFALFGYGVTRK